MLNLYIVKRIDYIGWDVYDSFMCAAENESQAENMHPDGGPLIVDEKDVCTDTWTTKNNVVSIFIGIASSDITTPQVLLASYKAG